jgi:hypothetical protein
MTTIRDVFDLPSREEIGAQSFVVKLESLRNSAARRKMIDDYVITAAVREQLLRVLQEPDSGGLAALRANDVAPWCPPQRPVSRKRRAFTLESALRPESKS